MPVNNDVIQFPREACEFDDPNKDATPVLRLKNQWFLEVVDASGIWTINGATVFTPIGGFAIKMTSGITPVPGKPRGADGGFFGIIPFHTQVYGRMHSIMTFPSGIA